MKKILALLLALCMIFALAACGGTAAKTDGKTDGGETVLKLWCIATESDANRPAYLQAIADYEDAVFFDILAEELARRDMVEENLSQDDMTELTNRMNDYMDEFEKNGVDRVVVEEE